ncbi:hypothetical protein EJ08DRAFT_661690 [Tothia fuscella]|uniref:DDE-1 domain-containing protein n=1 Tax=Tothia fuscella TaxID=1048955 RepID=A0A9P4TXZ8_9PEZI|nr:hypothetical protein EJ08DRAFT_661690 [Tothia fuscella]
MDEKGFLISILQKTKRIFTISANPNGPKRGAGQDGSREWITCIATICQDRSYIPPALIYPAVSGNIQDSWIHEVVPEDFYAYFASSPSGWTNDELGYSWLVKAGLQPFDPQVVLSRISTNKNDRPSTGTSGSSTASVLDPQNVRKVRQLIRRVKHTNPSRDVQMLSNAFVTLATNNACLTAKVEGLTKAIHIAEKRQKKGIPVLPAALLQPNEGKSQFWSPTKLKDEERITNAKKTAQEEEKIRKAEEKRDKQRRKEDQAIMVAQRKSDRERERLAKK